jgi:hypothetical protein
MSKFVIIDPGAVGNVNHNVNHYDICERIKIRYNIGSIKILNKNIKRCRSIYYISKISRGDALKRLELDPDRYWDDDIKKDHFISSTTYKK